MYEFFDDVKSSFLPNQINSITMATDVIIQRNTIQAEKLQQQKIERKKLRELQYYQTRE